MYQNPGQILVYQSSIDLILRCYPSLLAHRERERTPVFIQHVVFLCVCRFFSNMMPRGLDSVPNSMVLLVGVMVESLLVLLATLFVLRRFHGEQTTTDGCKVSDEVAYRWTDESKSIALVAESVKVAHLSGDLKTDETNPRHRSRVSSDTSNNCTTTSEKQQSLFNFPKQKIRISTIIQPRTPLEVVATSKANRAASTPTFPMTAHQLDWAFFVVAFVANTIFFIALYVFAFD